MLTYKTNISADEHDNFVSQHPQANLLQSSNWAKIKDHWGNERVGFYKDGKLVASASILIQPLPLGFTMLYIPRGPIMDYEDKDLVAFVLQSLKTIAKSHRALFVKFDPSLFLTRHLANEDGTESADTLAIIKNLESLGVEWTGRTMDLAENVQPRFQANIYADGFEEQNLSKSTKQAIRSARNKGLEVVFGGTELLDDFTELMKKTEDRKSIHLRGRDYYEKLLTTYPEASYITMSYLDLDKRIATLQEQVTKNRKEAESFTEKTRETKVQNNQKEYDRLSEEIAFLQEQLAKGRSRVPLSGTLSLEFGKTSENIYAGMDETYRRYQPPTITWFETAKHAFERGAIWQNMGGVENTLDGGLYRFKIKFNPQIEEYAGEFNLPTSPLYRLSNFAYKVRKKLRSKH